MTIPYYHVDAFTSELFAGNPAGVCILSAFPSDGIMQKIAAENRHSETAFVVPRADGDFDLRWFTPVVEDDLCGHATLASAFVLALRKHNVWPVHFHTRSGMLAVAQDGDGFAMDFPAMPPLPCEAPAGLLSALGLEAAGQDLQKIQVLRSRDHLVVLDRAEQVQALSPDFAALAEVQIGNRGPTGIIGTVGTFGTRGTIVSAPAEGKSKGGRGLENENNNADYVCRFFLPSAGIPEDPATGSIQCILAPYWAARLGKQTLRVQQLSARGATMQCTLGGDRVKIAGKARLYLQGTIEL